MKRRSFIVFSASILALQSSGLALANSTSADLPFLDDLIQLKPHIVNALRTVHSHVKDPNVIDDFDGTYDDMVASVNGLLEVIASDIESDHLHVDSWTKQANAIIVQANSFNASIQALRHGRRQAGAVSRSSSVTLGKTGVAVNIDLLDLLPMKKSLDDMRNAQAIADQKERETRAAQIRIEVWPERCALGLDKLPCPGATRTH